MIHSFKSLKHNSLYPYTVPDSPHDEHYADCVCLSKTRNRCRFTISLSILELQRREIHHSTQNYHQKYAALCPMRCKNWMNRQRVNEWFRGAQRCLFGSKETWLTVAAVKRTLHRSKASSIRSIQYTADGWRAMLSTWRKTYNFWQWFKV